MTRASVTRPDDAKRRSALFLLLPIVAVTLVLIFGAYEVLERTVLAPQLSIRALHTLHIVRGVIASVVLAGVVTWYLVRRGTPMFPPADAPVTPLSLFDRGERIHQHAQWFVDLRWIAAGFILALILIGVPLTGLLPSATLVPLLAWWVVLVLANVFFHRQARRRRAPERLIVVQIVVDLVVLTGLLNASGGLENPLYLAYLFHVIIAAILLPRRKALVVTAVAASLFLLLVVGEFTHVLPHYTNLLFPHEYAAHLSHGSAPSHAGAAPSHAAHDAAFVGGESLSFVLTLTLSAWLTMLVTDRLRQHESSLERTAQTAILERQRLESIVHGLRVGIVLLDRGLSVRWFSGLVAEWLGWDSSIVGQRCPLYASGDDPPTGPAVEVLRTGRPAEIEKRIPASGGVRHFRHVASPLRDAEGQIVQIVELVEDVTARRVLEAQALHASKMSLLGRMAAGIAHEIGNPLSSMATRLQLLMESNDAEYARNSLDLLQIQVDRIGRIVRGVSQFARSQRQDWTLWEANPAVEDALAIAELDPRLKGITVHRHLATPSPWVRGVRDQLVQVVLNLLLNAAEAMPRRGPIQVETFATEDMVGIAVEDQGAGMDEATQSRLFEPFFTTKAKGIGLGMSISDALVRSHGGRIEVISEQGTGSRFVVLLPTARSTSPAEEGTQT